MKAVNEESGHSTCTLPRTIGKKLLATETNQALKVIQTIN